MPEDGNWMKGLQHGFEVAVGVGLGATIGWWIDQHFHSSPWGLLIGLLLGCMAGMYLLIKEVSKMNKDK